MNSGKNEIHVVVENIITDSSSQNDSSSSSKPSIPTSDKQQQQTQSKTAGIGKAVIANAVNQAGQFALSNYGNLTGDYQTQANIQGGLEMIGLGVMALSSPVGAVAAVGSLVIKGINRQVDIAKKNQQVDLLRARTGMMNYSGGRK
jgi:hypothetical protein